MTAEQIIPRAGFVLLAGLAGWFYSDYTRHGAPLRITGPAVFGCTVCALVSDQQPPVEVLIGPGRDVTVKVILPRDEMTSLLGEFLGRGNIVARGAIERALAAGDSLTLLLTTKEEKK